MPEDTTSRSHVEPTNIESVDKILAEDYFKLKMEKEVRDQTQSQLGVWWKRIVGTVAIIIAIFAFFGVKEYFSLKSLVDDAKKKFEEDRKTLRESLDKDKEAFEKERGAFRAEINSDREALGKNAQELNSLIKGSQQELTKVQETLATVRSGQASYEGRVNQLLSDSTKSFFDIARQFGSLQKEIDSRVKLFDDSSSKVDKALNMTSNLQQDVKTSLVEMDTAIKKQNSDIGRFSGEVKEIIAKRFNSGSYILKEKNYNTIQTVPGNNEQQLVIYVYRVRGNSVIGMVIKDVNNNPIKVKDAQGQSLKFPLDVTEGSVLYFSLNNYDYTFTIRYIIELVFEFDRVGVDVSWSLIKLAQN